MTRSISLLGALPILSLLQTTSAIPEPNTIGFQFEKRKVDANTFPGLRRRQSGTVLAGLDNELSLYLINVTVGTPAQQFSLQLDTGSSDLWFPATDANVCVQSANNCPAGTYDQQASSSYSDPGLPEFQIQYVDGTEISGAYISDVLSLGQTKLTNLTMASATKLNALGVGIMGVGFRADESGAQGTQTSQGFTYPNIIDVLQSEGHINSRMYSLWLDDLNSNTGSILFGGVDTDKFKGNLVSLPIQLDSQSNSITSFTVAWTGLQINGSGNNVDASPSSPQPAILDSGTTDTLLPDSIAEQIFSGVGVTTTRQLGNVVPCDLANDDISFTFTFGGSGGPSITVPLSEFVVPLITSDGQSPKFRDGKTACQFAIEAAGQNPILFGDSFLRSAYVVYDLDNQQVAIAATNNQAQESNGNVQAASSSGGIPGVSSTATAASVAQSITGLPGRESDAATATGDINDQQTSRSATFKFSATGSSGGSSSTSSGAASSNVQTAPIQWQGVLSCGIVVIGMLFGGGLLVL